jgi:hypothetical protein
MSIYNFLCIPLLLLALAIPAKGHCSGKEYPPFIVEKLDRNIYGGVFTGNGLLGSVTYLKSDSAIRIDVGRTDTYDHRDEPIGHLFSKARLPIGHFEVVLHSCRILSSSGNMSIADANATAYIQSDKGALTITTTTLSERNYILIDVDKSKFQGTYKIRFVPAKSQSPRMEATWVDRPLNYKPNPQSVVKKERDIHLIDQPMLAGGGYATAYRITAGKKNDHITATITYSQTDHSYEQSAVDKVQTYGKLNQRTLLQAHRKWWADYMALSKYKFPDKKLQDFYNLQMYKFGCVTRTDKPAIDLQGPWPAFTPWPAYWFNLNIQLTYSPLYTANRLSIAESLIKMLNNNTTSLKENIHPDYRHDSYGLGRSGTSSLQTGKLALHRDSTAILPASQAELSNLTWVLFYYYQHYRVSMDDKLKAPLYKLLKGSINYMLHFVDKNQDGRYAFVVPTHSPEYPDSYDFNTNYDLATLRWGLATVLELGETEEIDLTYLQKIKNVLHNLIDYPSDENGYKISMNQSYDVSHRHYSHLMMIYPYYLVHADQPENIDMIKRSITHWQKGALQGYSLSGAGSMYAMLGNGDMALQYFRQLNDRFIQPNTLYKESGPVIETPFALANSLQELSLQFWGGKVRIFPAIPATWKDVSFKNFRTDGAFLISASKKDGITEKVEISSEHAGVIKLLIDQPLEHITYKGKIQILRQEGKEIELSMEKGSRAILSNTR